MEGQTQHDDLFDVEINSAAKKLISDIAIWAKIIAVTSFISYGLSIVVAVLGKAEEVEGFAAATGKAASIAGVLVSVIIGVIINIFLYKFATQARPAVENIDQGALENGFNNLRVYFKIVGILIIIFLSFMVLGLLLIGLGKGI